MRLRLFFTRLRGQFGEGSGDSGHVEARRLLDQGPEAEILEVLHILAVLDHDLL